MDSVEARRLESLRSWVAGHFQDATSYESVSGKLRVIDAILRENWIEAGETLKLQALGVCFGDALLQELPGLDWIVVDDDEGRAPALRYGNSSIVLFPVTAISKRVERGERVDVYHLFGEFLKGVSKAIEEGAA